MSVTRRQPSRHRSPRRSIRGRAPGSQSPWATSAIRRTLSGSYSTGRRPRARGRTRSRQLPRPPTLVSCWPLPTLRRSSSGYGSHPVSTTTPHSSSPRTRDSHGRTGWCRKISPIDLMPWQRTPMVEHWRSARLQNTTRKYSAAPVVIRAGRRSPHSSNSRPRRRAVPAVWLL